MSMRTLTHVDDACYVKRRLVARGTDSSRMFKSVRNHLKNEKKLTFKLSCYNWSVAEENHSYLWPLNPISIIIVATLLICHSSSVLRTFFLFFFFSKFSSETSNQHFVFCVEKLTTLHKFFLVISPESLPKIKRTVYIKMQLQ